MCEYNTYVCEYKLLPEHTTRESCMTFFGGMTEKDDLQELKNVKLLGRWAAVGEGKGYCVAQAKCNKDMQEWLTNWVTMADIKVMPCLDDNQQRELILGSPPSYRVTFDKVNSSALPNQSLYWIQYQFKPGSEQMGFNAFASLTEEEDKSDSGKCTPFGRWHIPSLGKGFAIASSPSVMDLYKWAYNWGELCNVEIIPVTEDKETRSIISNGFGFQIKYNKLMEELSQYSNKNNNNNNCCYPN